MEFWGVEVKAGEPLKVAPEPEHIIHLSQAALGESKNKVENVHVFVNFGNNKLVLGTLSQEKFPQITFDLVFEKEFELSHNWKNGSVFFCGYKSALPDESMSDFGSDEDEEDFPMIDAENGGVQPKSEKPKPAEKKAKIEEPIKPAKDEEEDSDEDDDSDEEGDDSDEEGDSDEGDDSEEDESESEDEETPKKAPQPSNKRPNEAAAKTPPPAKKSKQSPQKSDAKKNVHIATPHPAKQGGKAANGKTNQQTPKSGGQFACKSCSKTFGSDNALQSHTKAKHT